MLRRIAGIPHTYISRVSNSTTRRRCNATRLSIQIRWRLTNTGRKIVVGRPRVDLAQALIEIFCNFAQVSRPQMIEIASDKERYHCTVERLCRHKTLQL